VIRVPEPDYEPSPLESDDEDGFPWDCDRGGGLGNFDSEGGDED
jgi:hypothetical protein